MKLVRLVTAFVLPPVSIFLSYGLSFTLLVSVLLTFLGWIPGVIHALWALSKYEEQHTETV
jgi:putative membrane protein